MRAIAPRTGAHEDTVAEQQEEFLPITVAQYRFEFNGNPCNGVLRRYTFTPEERKNIAEGEDIYIMELHSDHLVTPMEVRCGPGNWKV